MPAPTSATPRLIPDLPWSADELGGVHRSEIDGNGHTLIGDFGRPAWAQYVVTAVNSFDALVEALDSLLTEAGEGGGKPQYRAIDLLSKRTIDRARHVLALARSTKPTESDNA